MKQLLLSNIPTVYLANHGYLHNDQTRLAILKYTYVLWLLRLFLKTSSK